MRPSASRSTRKNSSSGPTIGSSPSSISAAAARRTAPRGSAIGCAALGRLEVGEARRDARLPRQREHRGHVGARDQVGVALVPADDRRVAQVGAHDRRAEAQALLDHVVELGDRHVLAARDPVQVRVQDPDRGHRRSVRGDARRNGRGVGLHAGLLAHVAAATVAPSAFSSAATTLLMCSKRGQLGELAPVPAEPLGGVEGDDADRAVRRARRRPRTGSPSDSRISSRSARAGNPTAWIFTSYWSDQK